LPVSPESETRAAVTPVTRLAPVELFTAPMPAVCRILETILVVVVLPLVPVIAAEPSRRRRESLVNTFGSTLRATTPGTVEPPPVLSLLLASRADLAASIAAESRISSVGRSLAHGVGWRARGSRTRGSRTTGLASLVMVE
jgi:uncharacterized membrane protein YccC